MKRAIARELMDDPVESRDELEANLADIACANRRFGGIAPVAPALRRVDAASLLDVCCGSADVPLAIARDSASRGRDMSVTVLDRSGAMLAAARERAGHGTLLTFVNGDATALPFGDGSFDVVTCNLALHHFEPDAVLALLREMRRVARIFPLVCDVRRSWTGYVAALVWSRVFSRNRLTRHDAPLSVRRAYTPREALAFAVDAGWRSPRVRREAFFRMTLSDDAESRS